MYRVTSRDVLADNKGKLYEKKNPRPEIADLHEVSGLDRVDNFGDYCWQPLSEEISCLILACPFCGKVSPLPTLTDVESREPLTLKQDLTCGNCSQNFYVIRGQAIKGWGKIELGGTDEKVANQGPKDR